MEKADMRILAIADIHGSTEVYEWLPKSIAQYGVDALILAGDLLLGGWEEEQSRQAHTFVMPLLISLPIPTFFIMGNDDHIDIKCTNEKVQSIHSRCLAFGSYGIMGYQFSPPFLGSCHEKPEEKIAKDLCKIESNMENNTVLVTHTPAYGYADRIHSESHVGSHALTECLERNDVLCHIHGHIHNSFGRCENHFNVAAGGKRRAMIIDLPSLSHRIING